MACAVALAGVAAWDVGERVLATACRAAEERATGVPCGIMDQLVSLAGQEGAAILIDCRTLELRPVPLPPGLGVLVVNSGVQRSLDATPYAERRRACALLAEKLGLVALRDASESQVEDEPLGRHVVTENARVLEAERALVSGDSGRLGRILNESHASLRDDFGISTQELDLLVEELVAAGAFGARLTGGGFGGSVVAVCPREAMDEISDVATARYRDATGLEPHAFVCRAANGAGSIDPLSGVTPPHAQTGTHGSGYNLRIITLDSAPTIALTRPGRSSKRGGNDVRRRQAGPSRATCALDGSRSNSRRCACRTRASRIGVRPPGEEQPDMPALRLLMVDGRR